MEKEIEIKKVTEKELISLKKISKKQFVKYLPKIILQKILKNI